jgi:adenine phosphoribosyltransferase
MKGKDVCMLKDKIRDIPNFPKEGIIFKDITPLLLDMKSLKEAADRIADHYRDKGVQKVMGAEARGLIIATLVAERLEAGMIPVRKPGKLPHKTIAASYELEYGTDTLEIHNDAIAKGEKVLVVDDLLATGGTAKACCELAEKLGGVVEGVGFVIELSSLQGRGKLKAYDVISLITYD